MQMLKQKNKKAKNKNIKKSQFCLFGSLLIIGGLYLIFGNYIKELKKEIFSDMQLAMTNGVDTDEVIEDIPEVEERKENPVQENNKKEVDYSVYTGVLEIPRIGLKRGFYNLGNRYNSINYNVTVVSGSTMPDVVNGNLIFAAHSGDAYISYFAYLYKLNVGDFAYVTYGGTKYKYQIVNIYNVPKTGSVTIVRNMSKTTLTLITCTKDSDTEQTVYIAELS